MDKLKWTKRKKIVVGVVSLLCIINIPIYIHLFWEIHEAKYDLSAFHDALIVRNYRAAYDMTTPELKSNVDYASFVKVLDGLIKRVGILQRVDVSETEVRNDENGHFATIRARLIFERGQLPFVFVLKKDSKHWRLYSFSEL